jgi:hypothetical protein
MNTLSIAFLASAADDVVDGNVGRLHEKCGIFHSSLFLHC